MKKTTQTIKIIARSHQRIDCIVCATDSIDAVNVGELR